jgi:putative pyruvate formate lyase activating enzyme
MKPKNRESSKETPPVYHDLFESGRLSERVAKADAALLDYHLCGNHCHIDRTQRPGPCGIQDVAYVASYGPHHGEEDVLRGRYGSGTIFFSGCNLHCVYCQNADISQQKAGIPVSDQDLADIILDLQDHRCHNVNVVSPTHVVPMIVKALARAIPRGLHIPIVYNTGGYDGAQALNLMENLIDIYMPDMKYADSATGLELSGVKDYPEVNRQAVNTMHQQVGDLKLNTQGWAYRGLLTRHLVLPGQREDTRAIVQFLAQEVSKDTALNLMAQYRPSYRAHECATANLPINRRITPQEYQVALQMARQIGLHRFV